MLVHVYPATCVIWDQFKKCYLHHKPHHGVMRRKVNQNGNHHVKRKLPFRQKQDTNTPPFLPLFTNNHLYNGKSKTTSTCTCSPLRTPMSFGHWNMDLQQSQPQPQPQPRIGQIRRISTTSEEEISHVSDEEVFDNLLKERELEMYRHPMGPIHKMTKLAREALKMKEGRDEIEILDIDSQPADSMLVLAEEYPDTAAVHFISTSADCVQQMSDKVLELGRPNIVTTLSGSHDSLEDYGDDMFDVVLSCFGLHPYEDPQKVVNEVHRVLKPGGTFIASVWKHLQTDLIANQLLKRALLTGKPTLTRTRAHTTTNWRELSSINTLTRPHQLEKMIEDSGLWTIALEHGEFPLTLSPDGLPSFAFDVISIPIKSELASLVTSGDQPYAFEDARAEFDDIVAKGKGGGTGTGTCSSSGSGSIKRDASGGLVVEDNRYKIIVARRRYEDEDTTKRVKKMSSEMHTHHMKAADAMEGGEQDQDTKMLQGVRKDFDAFLSDAFHIGHRYGHRYSPMKHIELAIKNTVKAEGHDLKKLRILDVKSHPNELRHIMADAFPDSRIHHAGYVSQLRAEEEGKTIDTATDTDAGLDITDSSLVQERQLSLLEDASEDIITCIFGLHYIQDPVSVLREVRRVLKPGGVFIATTWDRISLENISNQIMSRVLGKKLTYPIPPSHELLGMSEFATPHKLENLMEQSGFGVTEATHYEFPFILSEGDKGSIVNDNDDQDKVFDLVTLPIRRYLTSLEETGSNPNAITDARHVLDEMIKNKELLSFDKHGSLISSPNRFKLVVARRLFD